MLKAPSSCKGGYKPGLQPDLSQIVMWALIAMNLVRGIDYATGERDLGKLSFVETSLDIEAWGLIFIGTSILMAHGLIACNFRSIISSATVSAAAYATLAVSSVWGNISAGWPPNEFRGSMVYLFFGIISGCYAYGAYLKRYVCRVEEMTRESERKDESGASRDADPDS